MRAAAKDQRESEKKKTQQTPDRWFRGSYKYGKNDMSTKEINQSAGWYNAVQVPARVMTIRKC